MNSPRKGESGSVPKGASVGHDFFHIDVREGVAFSCVLAVLCGLTLTKASTSFDTSILIWLGFVVSAGVVINLHHKSPFRTALFCGFPFAIVLVLVGYFKILVICAFGISSSANELAKEARAEMVGPRWLVPLISVGPVYFPVRSVSDRPASSAKVEDVETTEARIPDLGSSVGWAWFKVTLFYVLVAAISACAVAICCYARRAVVNVTKNAMSLNLEEMRRFEKVANTVVRIGLTIGAAFVTWFA